MRGSSRSRSGAYAIVALVVTTMLASQAHAGSLTFSVNLLTGSGDSPLPPYITYEVPPQDANGDGWFETVLKINLSGSPYDQATFQVQYAALPTGSVNVDIGDSRTNDSGGGDAGTQSNDAEIHVGREETQFNKDLYVFGKDGTPTPGGLLAQAPNFVVSGTTTATFTVRNEFVSWDDHQGVSGSLSSPYPFALAGQPDSEGPVNYDIYAAFNRIIAGPYRFGTGVGSVTVTLSSIPEPSSLILLSFGLASVGFATSRRKRALRR